MGKLLISKELTDAIYAGAKRLNKMGYKPEMIFVNSKTKVDFLTPSKPKYIHEELRCEI